MLLLLLNLWIVHPLAGITLIDKSISELELRFTKLSHFASRLLFLIPTVITKVPLGKDSYQQVIKMHGKGLLYKDVVEIELSSWKQMT